MARAARKAKNILLQLVRAGNFQRNDYKFAAQLILIFLGVQIRPGSNFLFPDLAKASNARFIQRCLFFILMELLMDVPAVHNMFSPREQDTIRDMALFSAVYYGPYFLQTTIASSAARQDLVLIEDLRNLREHKRAIAEATLKVMDRHTDYLGPPLVTMALADDGLEVEERQDLATAISREVADWDGSGFPRTDVLRPTPYFATGNLYWAGGTPRLSNFVASESLTVFELIGQQPDDLQWLNLPVAEWENNINYMEFSDYVKSKSVVNDPAERALGLIKPLVKHYKKESNLQAAMVVTKKARMAWPITRSTSGKLRSNLTKSQLSKIKPSELLKRDEDVNDTSDEGEMEDPGDDILDL